MLSCYLNILFQKRGTGLGVRSITFIVNQLNRYFFDHIIFDFLSISFHNLWSWILITFQPWYILIINSIKPGLATSFILLLSYTLSSATYDRVRPSLFVSEISFPTISCSDFHIIWLLLNEIIPGGVIQHNSVCCLHGCLILAGHASLHAGIKDFSCTE